MTKAELINSVAGKTGESQAVTGKVLESVLDQVTSVLSQGGAITFTGFGSFSVSHRAQRQGRNPQTGQAMTIPASRVARFKPGKGLKDSLAGRR